MSFFTRTKTGGLKVDTLDLQIFFDDLFYLAKDEEEIDFIYETIESCMEISREDVQDALDND